MELREIIDKHAWEDFFAPLRHKTFLQSWAWGEFHETMGQKIWRLGAFDKTRLAGAALVAKIQAKRGIFLTVQHAPPANSDAFRKLFEGIRKIGRQEGAIFLRIAPLWENEAGNQEFFRQLGCRQAPTHANAYESTWKLDIAPSAEELFARMRKTTRSIVRQALNNKDITIEKHATKEAVPVFLALNREVGKRQRFIPFSKEYTEAEFDVFAKDNSCVFVFGKHRGKVAAGALVIFWSGVGFYHQAASLGEYAKYSIPYLVQWEAIMEAKRRGCGVYDFWGFVHPKKHPKHPWAGPTLFKMGFGGQAYEYVKTQDYPLSWKYWPIAAFEAIRKRKRKL